MTGYCPSCGAQIRVLTLAETFHCRRCGTWANVEYLHMAPKNQEEKR